MVTRIEWGSQEMELPRPEPVRGPTKEEEEWWDEFLSRIPDPYVTRIWVHADIEGPPVIIERIANVMVGQKLRAGGREIELQPDYKTVDLSKYGVTCSQSSAPEPADPYA